MLKRFVELGREGFCVPHLTTLWDTMSPTRHETQLSHLEGDCRSSRLMLSPSGCWTGRAAADPKPQHPHTSQHSLLPAGSSHKRGYPAQPDHPCGRAEGASRKLQPNVKFADHDNYHDMFLLPLTTAGSGSCNIPSASLPEHKLGREA